MMPCTFFANHLKTPTEQKKSVNSGSLFFYFGSAKKTSKGIAINTPKVYNPESGYGFDFESASNVSFSANAFLSEKPTYFSVKVPEGNYQIELVLSSNKADSKTTVKAESRRLMLKEIPIKKGQKITKIFNVNIRSIKIDNESSMDVKDREKDDLNWDDKLTLEFLGDVVVESIKITNVKNLTVVYLAGDSTVTDQDIEPWASWGQFITNYFDKNIVVANYAVSGSALSSFKATKRLKKIMSVIKPGDYLIVEFGHNDEKLKGEENGPWRSYSDLLTEYVQAAKAKGAIPILVTPTQRRFFNPDGITLKATHGDFPDAMRAVAKKTNVPLIDITQMTTTLYEKWGDEPSRKAFVQYPINTFPGQTKALDDNTHFNSFGANEIALCVTKGFRDLNIPLAKNLTKETPLYNPQNPNYISAWTLPMSTRFEIVKPEGN